MRRIPSDIAIQGIKEFCTTRERWCLPNSGKPLDEQCTNQVGAGDYPAQVPFAIDNRY